MADYKVVDAEKLNSDLSAVAESIREQADPNGGLLIFPDGFISAVEGIQKGIIPTKTIDITQNVSNMDITYGKTLNVNVQPSSEYIKKTDTKIYVTKFNCGTFSDASERMLSQITIPKVGFKPKIFYMRMYQGVNNTTTKNYVVAMIMVLDNNYTHFKGSDGMNTGGPVSIYYNNGARSNHSQGNANLFTAFDDGVKGSGISSTMYLQAGKGFQWYAWG